MTHDGGTVEGDALTAATREAASRARRRAEREVPTPDDLAGMAMGAGRARDMSAAEIRVLAADAIRNAQEISFLLGRLAELVDEEREP